MKKLTRIDLQEVNRTNRVARCRGNLFRNVETKIYWSRVIFSDEFKVIIGRDSRVSVWRKVREEWLTDCIRSCPVILRTMTIELFTKFYYAYADTKWHKEIYSNYWKHLHVNTYHHVFPSKQLSGNLAHLFHITSLPLMFEVWWHVQTIKFGELSNFQSEQQLI